LGKYFFMVYTPSLERSYSNFLSLRTWF
jgi:hypothetical protein